ncbi:hypothetical protein VCRA2127O15_90116 [Vibrio crassostreae]|nr:hypothetical protein VCRA2127O15_90116 [Vibrio crassostreae]
MGHLFSYWFALIIIDFRDWLKNDKRLIECDGYLKNKAALNYLKARHSSIHASTSLSTQATALPPRLID